MLLHEFADLIKKDLVLRRYNNKTGSWKWLCSFDHCEVKEGCMLVGEYGIGPSPEEAMSDYAKNIKGKKIIFNATDKAFRQEFDVPEITYDDTETKVEPKATVDKLCVKCKFCVDHCVHDYNCHHKDSVEIDVVTGKRIYTRCDKMRKDVTKCGPSGDYWEYGNSRSWQEEGREFD